ncbi:MAG: SufS family cysteine desulfurase [Bacteroidales bacterium]|nr:SufS family cysteine desulfurase [Bacteroidales bacterium]MDY5781376.1 SufS family cysteine desulfurase [Candidatus Cryptobacteroides sp.]
MNVRSIREQFPILSTKVYGKDLVYFDNAATSQRPASVIDKWNRLTSEFNANIHRGVHRLAEVATDEYETTRDAVRNFINAESREEIVFTSGTTASINLVAFSFGEAFVKEGDEIIVSEAEHHSNIVPWQMLCMRKNAVLKVLRIDDNGHFNLDELKSLITEHTRIVAVTQISNVLGIVNPVEEIVRICHERNVPVLIDGAQGVVHGGIDVRKVDCDFYAFSGHKMYAATGVGVLYGKKQWLDAMPPYMGGGEMIARVRFSGTTYADTPEKFEAGTQNFASVPTLKPAIEMMRMMQDEELQAELENVKEYLYGKLTENENITLYGVPRGTLSKIPLFSFSVKDVHHEDLALILDKMGIASRSGQMCAEPVMDRFGVTGMLRISLAPYNTMEEAEYFIKSLDKAISMLR